MPRSIDAEHLKKRATDWFGDCWDNYAQSTEDFLEYIDNEPTVDAVEVVRCENCESWGLNAIKTDEKGRVMYGDCLHFCVGTPRGFYCAWGERKEDG